jgi:cell division protein FtsI (penicillin-binding protein 3)
VANKKEKGLTHPVRYWLVALALGAGFATLAARAFYLQVLDSDYLQRQGDARHLRVVEVAASRGMIIDRNGEPLAISTPVDTVTANPPEFAEGRAKWGALARVLGIDAAEIADAYARNADREFMYLRRHITPEVAARVTALDVPGVSLRREYRRYYPAGPITGQVLGFADIDDVGREGLELAFDNELRGVPGKKLVIKDGKHDTIEDVASIRTATDGRDLTISLDSRIQYLAYRALKAAVQQHHARSGSVVVLDARSGEVLAMVNEPDFNPNNWATRQGSRFRNRAVTDVMEPGSSIKPFTIAAALESENFTPDTLLDTAPGFLRVGSYTIHDTHDYGRLTVAHVIMKSSNVGATKIAMGMDKRDLWEMFRAVGFGRPSAIELPGESSGRLAPYRHWRPVEYATMSFGYGLSVTPLQLARAYTALANDGVLMPVTILRRTQAVIGQRAMAPGTAQKIRAMLELAVSREGTGFRANVARYKVAGKTGTVHRLTPEGYAQDRYMAVFAGMAPASHPRLVMAVMVDDPTTGGYYGGLVAAPVFSQVMAGALRLLNVAPDGPALDVAQKIAAYSGGAQG